MGGVVLLLGRAGSGRQTRAAALEEEGRWGAKEQL